MPKIVDHDERRARLIKAFWDVVDNEGSDVPSVRSVAQAAGVSKTNVGHYFSSQGQLVAEAALWDVQSNTDRIIASDLSACDLDDASTALSRLCVPSAIRRRHGAVLLHAWMLSAQDPQLQPIIAQIHSCQAAAVEHVLVAMRSRRLVHRSRDLIEEGEQTVAFLNGLVVQGQSMPVNFPPARVRQLLTAHLADMSARPR